MSDTGNMRSVVRLALVAAFLIALVPIAGQATAGSLSGYSYVKTHAMLGSEDGPLVDYQVKFIVHRGAGEDSGENVYLNDNSQNWPEDFRFTDEADRALAYWIESSDNNIATVWVKAEYLQGDHETTTLKLYYGKPGDTGASSGKDTFVFFDDASSLSRWETNGASTDGTTISVGAGECAMTRLSFDCYNTAFRCRIITGPGPNWQKYFGWGGDTTFYLAPGDGCGVWVDNGWGGITRLQYGSNEGPKISFPEAKWYVYDLYISNAGDKASVYRDGIAILEGEVACDRYQKWMMSSHRSCGGTFKLDWLALRHMTDSEPAHGAWSDEKNVGSATGIYCCLGCLCASAGFLFLVLFILIAYSMLKK